MMMMPTTMTAPSNVQYPVAIRQDADAWIVTVGDQSYSFGASEEAAQTFAALATAHTAALVDWTAQATEILRLIEDMLARAGKLQVIYSDNELYALLLAAPPGSLLPGVKRTLQRLLAIGCFFQDITVFMGGDLVGVPAAPIPLGKRRAVVTVRD